MRNFKEIVVTEKMVLPDTPESFKRVQRYRSNYSIEFELDRDSRELLGSKLCFKCSETLLKKMAENIILLNKQRHKKTHIKRMELMKLKNYRYGDNSFYLTS